MPEASLADRKRQSWIARRAYRNGPFKTEFALNNKQAPLPQAPLRIAAAQAQPVSGDVTANIARTVELTCLAADRGAKLVVFPEKFISGYEPDLIAGDPAKYAFDQHDARLEPIRAVCRQREIAVIVGAATRWKARWRERPPYFFAGVQSFRRTDRAISQAASLQQRDGDLPAGHARLHAGDRRLAPRARRVLRLRLSGARAAPR